MQPIRHDIPDPASPVVAIPSEDPRAPEAGLALCLSGGGYRAMLFHVGAVWRLNEAGLLRRLARVSSVSGGSITAALLGYVWKRLDFDGDGRVSARSFELEVVEPIRRLASRTIDVPAIVIGALVPGTTAADRVAAAYRTHLYGDATLANLPADDEGPRFVINASNMQTGALWRFSRPYIADYRLGRIRDTSRVSLAQAVAASSAFPPVLSPLTLKFEPSDFTREAGNDLTDEAYATEVVLSDGGVYDNLGLETAFKRYRTLLVSDAGELLHPDASQPGDWARHALRVVLMLYAQVTAMRKRQLIAAFKRGERDGAYWGIRSELRAFPLADPIDFDRARAAAAASTPTRLAGLDDDRQLALIDWGYAACDTALRAHVDPTLPRPSILPSGAAT